MGASPFAISITEASLAEKPIVERLMQLYQYDFAAIDGTEIGADGLYAYTYLDLYWTEPERTPLLVHVEGKLAGFVLVNQHTYTPQGRWSIAEFFILRNYRRQGIGQQVSLAVLERFGPGWEIHVTAENTVAQAFWQDVVTTYAGSRYAHWPEGWGEWTGPMWVDGR